jgi:hypothetical protein
VPSEYIKDLVDHKRRVAGYLQIAANDLFRRATAHDNSKFSSEEFDAYEEAFPGLQKYAYGTEEFKAELKKIEPAIQHHYSVNDHHPEYFANGINGMSLVQILEMVFDWLAASARSKTDFLHGLEINKARFGIGDQLFEVIKNTVWQYAPERLGPDPRTLYPDVLLAGEEGSQ